jgi:hypothetical protein
MEFSTKPAMIMALYKQYKLFTEAVAFVKVKPQLASY